LKKSGNNSSRDLINEIISESSGDHFKFIFKNLNNEDKKKFNEIVIQNKFSPNFLEFIGKNNLYNLFDSSFLENCENQKRRFQINSLHSIREVHLLNKIFISEGLKPLYLKGIALQREYKDVALRPFVDIDILFDRSEILKAYEVLHQKNFLDPREAQYLNNQNIEDFCRKIHHIHLVTRNGISIELHHRITRTKFFLCCPIKKSMLKDTREVDFYGEKINIPSINNLVLHQLCHFFSSDFNRLIRTLNDLRVITKNHNINFHEILSKINNKKIRKSMLLSLEVINFNNITIENLNKIRSDFANDYPNNEIILEAQKRLFDTSKKITIQGGNLFKNINKPGKVASILVKRIFPGTNSLIFEYKISKPTKLTILKKYINYIFLQILKLQGLSSFFHTKKTNHEYLKHTDIIDLWFNRN
tara:strand:- start:3682 stop:4932 length:1251 start_codon:yes stop_codon:yes gene_type:complete